MLIIRKYLAAFVVTVLLSTHAATPALAFRVPKLTPAKVAAFDMQVSIKLTRLHLTVSRAEASKALTSPYKDMYDAQALTFLTVYAKGWPMKQWYCLNHLWSSESGFNPLAHNKSSGAYGIAQFMPQTWGNYKLAKTSVPSLQIQYGLHYIDKRYGSACNAWNFWQKHYWY